MTETIDEATVEKMTRIADFCRQLNTDARPVMPAIEPIVAQTDALRQAADAAGLNRRERLAIADAVGKSIREGME